VVARRTLPKSASATTSHTAHSAIPYARSSAPGPPKARSPSRAPRKVSTVATIGTRADAASPVQARPVPSAPSTAATRIAAGGPRASPAAAAGPTAVTKRSTRAPPSGLGPGPNGPAGAGGGGRDGACGGGKGGGSDGGNVEGNVAPDVRRRASVVERRTEALRSDTGWNDPSRPAPTNKRSEGWLLARASCYGRGGPCRAALPRRGTLPGVGLGVRALISWRRWVAN